MPTLPPPPCFQNPSSTHVHDAPPPPPPPSPLGLGWLPPHPYVSLYLSLLHWMAPTLSSMDASHDLDHLIRVTRLSFELARSEHVTDPGSLQRILVLAMLHDVADHKYHAEYVLKKKKKKKSFFFFLFFMFYFLLRHKSEISNTLTFQFMYISIRTSVKRMCGIGDKSIQRGNLSLHFRLEWVLS
ncbi:hypothetical protein HMI56_004064 [Coelomomyces lativittatus]|nr:hypothetical protein HMI56_004064 [Coelomomyces lativittatus]